MLYHLYQEHSSMNWNVYEILFVRVVPKLRTWELRRPRFSILISLLREHEEQEYHPQVYVFLSYVMMMMMNVDDCLVSV